MRQRFKKNKKKFSWKHFHDILQVRKAGEAHF